MEKEFNVTGSCHPGIHYMVDTSDKIDQIIKLIEKGKYFTVNRPRQYGKSTCLESIERRLSPGEYLVIFTTFESMSDIDFLDERNFIREFSRQINKVFKKNQQQQLMDFIEKNKNIETFGQLDDFITEMVELIGICKKPGEGVLVDF